MNTVRNIELVRLDVDLQSVASVVGLTVAVAASEASLFFGEVEYTVWAYAALLVALSLAPLRYERETPVFLAFALIAAFRLVNLTMPVFVELTLLWLPLVYGPFILVVGYLGWQTWAGGREPSDPLEEGEPRREDEPEDGPSPYTGSQDLSREFPWWLGGMRGGKLRWLLRRIWEYLTVDDDGTQTERSVAQRITKGVVVVLLPVVTIVLLASLFALTVFLSEFEYSLITPEALVTSLSRSDLALLAVVMVVFVGFVEEFLFRGLLQGVLETRFGFVPGLLLASGIYGLVHSAYGEPTVLLFAGAVGLLFGIIYKITDSLVLVSVMHGLQNIFLFGIIPLDGPLLGDILQLLAAGGL